jgi:hypothetical protein
VFLETGGFDEGFIAAGLQDVEWYARLMRVTDAVSIEEPLTLFRRHGVRIPTAVMFRNAERLLDRLSEMAWNQDQRDYLLDRRVSHLSDLGKFKLAQGHVTEGRETLCQAMRLAWRSRRGWKMARRSALRLGRSYLVGRVHADRQRGHSAL